jgi:hypothetical protein
VRGEMILKSDINFTRDSHTTRDQSNNPPIIINTKKSNNKNEAKKFVNSSSSSGGMAKSSSNNNIHNNNNAFQLTNHRNNMNSSQIGATGKIVSDKAVSSLKSGERYNNN